jgi:hypothetical protein
MPHLDQNLELGKVRLTIGSQWWSVTSKTFLKGQWLVNQQKNIEVYFKKIECSDDSFFGSIFHHSSEDHINHGTTYVQWIDRGFPKWIKVEDLKAMDQGKDFLFTRRVTSGEASLIASRNCSM